MNYRVENGGKRQFVNGEKGGKQPGSNQKREGIENLFKEYIRGENEEELLIDYI